MQRSSARHATDSVLATLAGDDCDWCSSGTLVRGRFKGDDAVVCEDCETPAVRVW
ncbi:HVO_A0556 family zinc finger protein [Halorussus marinus]|uniref:HVO_A0556 family zinc finger protein n=1 Tax=Halorussus marinus TaxID=2505976 RepID=UPI0014321ACE|nr:HVO_A0556 family zinc finger protein [Halorussus marinus]